jgi:hypothetical protein
LVCPAQHCRAWLQGHPTAAPATRPKEASPLKVIRLRAAAVKPLSA